MNSIRARLNFSIIGSMILILPLAAGFLYGRVAIQVERVFDTALLDKAHALMSLTELDEEGLEFDFAEPGVMLEFSAGDAPQYYQLWENGTDLLIKSPSLADRDLPRIDTALGQHRFADLLLQDGRNGRLIEINFLPRIEQEDDEEEASYDQATQPNSPITMVYARERDSLDKTLFAIGFTIFGVIVAVLTLSTLMIWRLVGSGLSPLSNLARRVGEINESNLDVRLAIDTVQSTEIAPIEKQLNHLLERLQSAFEREKRFSFNVAHELRTPLSELKTLVEVGLMVPDDIEQVVTFFEDVGAISEQMETVVITLLELARSEAGLLRSDPEDIVLSNFCDEVWKQAINGQGADKILLRNIPSDLVINTDRDKFGMILSNLFSNAISYSPEQAEIQISASIRDNVVVLDVKNASIDLKPEDVVHMRDRFWRKQRAHTDGAHSGLGLTLVDALARIMKLDLSLELDNHQTFMVTLTGLHPSIRQSSRIRA